MDFPELRNLYRIEQEIGRGSFGIVYKAYKLDRRDQTPYAIKRVFCTVNPELIKSEILLNKLLEGVSSKIV
jgi:serine/threonine protein kinase